MTVLDAVHADDRSLTHVAGLIYTLYVRISHVKDASGTREAESRALLAWQTWQELDELGVDLNMPDLKAAIAVGVAGTETSSGADDVQPSTPEPHLAEGVPADEEAPAPLEPTDAGAGYFDTTEEAIPHED